MFCGDLNGKGKESEVAQSCPALCHPMDCSLPGSSVHGIFQARVLGWVAISFSNAWKQNVKVKSLSRVWLCATPWTGAYQVPPSMGFSRQEYWSRVPVPFKAKIDWTAWIQAFLNWWSIGVILKSFGYTVCLSFLFSNYLFILSLSNLPNSLIFYILHLCDLQGQV